MAVGSYLWNHWFYHVSRHLEIAGLVEQWNGLSKMQLEHQVGGHTCRAGAKFLQNAVYILKQCPKFGTVSLIIRCHGSTNIWVEIGLLPLTITLSDALAKFSLPVPITLYSADLEALVSEVGRFLPGRTTVIPLNWKLRLPHGHFGFCVLRNQQAKNWVTVMAGVSDPDYHGKIGLLFHIRGKEKYV